MTNIVDMVYRWCILQDIRDEQRAKEGAPMPDRMIRCQVYLPPSLIDELDAEVERQVRLHPEIDNRSALIRHMARYYLDAPKRAQQEQNS